MPARPHPAAAFLLSVLMIALAVMGSPPRADGHAVLLIDTRGAEGSLFKSIPLDRAALSALPQTGFETHTVWTDGPQQFRGVALATLLAHLDISAAHIDLEAVNNYRVSLPVAEIGPDNPIIALTRNGAAMSLRDMGPFWLVYNYDANPEFRTELIYARSIWQLARITVPAPQP
ncbi:hypothetical protein ACSSV8_002237 [Roseovarius sp. MBR-79]|jgi:hypothetical protein